MKIMDVTFLNRTGKETRIKMFNVSIKEYGLEENLNIAQIVLSDTLIEDLVKNPICGPSDYSGLPGVEISSSWRSYSEFPRRPNIAARTNRSTRMSHDERAWKNEKIRMKKEKMAGQRLAKREWRIAQQQARRDKALLLDKWLNTEKKVEQGINPGLVITSPTKGLTGKFSIFTPKGESRSNKKKAATGKGRAELCDLAQRMSPDEICKHQRLSGRQQSDRLPLSSSPQVGGYVTPTLKRCQAKQSKLKTGSCKTKKSFLEGDKKDPFRANDSQVKALIKMAFSSSLNQSQDETPSQNLKIAEVDRRTYSAAQRQRRNLKRICYTETPDYDEDEDLGELPSRAQTDQKSHSVKRTLEKAFDEVNVMNLKMKKSDKDKPKIRHSLDDSFISSESTVTQFQQEAIDNPITSATLAVASAVGQSELTFTHGQQQLLMDKLVACATQLGQDLNLSTLDLSNQTSADQVAQPEVSAQPNSSLASIPAQAHWGRSELKLLPRMSAASSGKSLPVSPVCLGSQPLLASDSNDSATVRCQNNLLHSGHPPHTNTHSFGPTSRLSLPFTLPTYPSFQQSCLSVSYPGSFTPKNQAPVLSSTISPHDSPDEKHPVVFQPIQRPVQAVNPKPFSELKMQDTISAQVNSHGKMLLTNSRIVSNSVLAYLINQSTQNFSTKGQSQEPVSKLKLNNPQSPTIKSQGPDKSGVANKKRTRCLRQLTTESKMVSSKEKSQPLPPFNKTTSSSGLGPSPAVTSASDLNHQGHLQSGFLSNSSDDQYLPEVRITSLATPVLNSQNPSVISSSKTPPLSHDRGSDPSLEVHKRNAEIVCSERQLSQQQKSIRGVKNGSDQLRDPIRNTTAGFQKSINDSQNLGTNPQSKESVFTSKLRNPQSVVRKSRVSVKSGVANKEKTCQQRQVATELVMVSSKEKSQPLPQLNNTTSSSGLGPSPAVTSASDLNHQGHLQSGLLPTSSNDRYLPEARITSLTTPALSSINPSVISSSKQPAFSHDRGSHPSLEVHKRNAEILSSDRQLSQQQKSICGVKNGSDQLRDPIRNTTSTSQKSIPVSLPPFASSHNLAPQPPAMQNLSSLQDSLPLPIPSKNLWAHFISSPNPKAQPTTLYSLTTQPVSSHGTTIHASSQRFQPVNSQMQEATQVPSALPGAGRRAHAQDSILGTQLSSQNKPTIKTALNKEVNVSSLYDETPGQVYHPQKQALSQNETSGNADLTNTLLKANQIMSVSNKNSCNLTQEQPVLNNQLVQKTSVPRTQKTTFKHSRVRRKDDPLVTKSQTKNKISVAECTAEMLRVQQKVNENVAAIMRKMGHQSVPVERIPLVESKKPKRKTRKVLLKDTMQCISKKVKKLSVVNCVSSGLLQVPTIMTSCAPSRSMPGIPAPLNTLTTRGNNMSTTLDSLASSIYQYQISEIEQQKQPLRAGNIHMSSSTPETSPGMSCAGSSNVSNLSHSLLNIIDQTMAPPPEFRVDKKHDLQTSLVSLDSSSIVPQQSCLESPENNNGSLKIVFPAKTANHAECQKSVGLLGSQTHDNGLNLSPLSPNHLSSRVSLSKYPPAKGHPDTFSIRPQQKMSNLNSQSAPLPEFQNLQSQSFRLPQNLGFSSFISTKPPTGLFVSQPTTTAAQLGTLTVESSISLRSSDKDISSHSPYTAAPRQSNTNILSTQSQVEGIQSHLQTTAPKGVEIQSLAAQPQSSAYVVTTQSPGKGISSHSLFASPQRLSDSTNLSTQSPARGNRSHSLSTAQQRSMSDLVNSLIQSPTRGVPSHSLSTTEQRLMSDLVNSLTQSPNRGVPSHLLSPAHQRLKSDLANSSNQSPTRGIPSHLLSTAQQSLSDSVNSLTQSPTRGVPSHLLSTAEQRLKSDLANSSTQSPTRGVPSHLLSTAQQRLMSDSVNSSTKSPTRGVPSHSLSTAQQSLSDSAHILSTQSPAKGLQPWSPTRPLNLITGLVKPSPRTSVKDDRAVNTSVDHLNNNLMPNSVSSSQGSQNMVRTLSDNIVRMTTNNMVRVTTNSMKPPESSFAYLKVCVDLNHNDNENSCNSEPGNEAFVETAHGNDANNKEGSFFNVTPTEQAINSEPQSYYRETSSLPHESPKRTSALEVLNEVIQPLFSSPTCISGIAHSQKFSNILASPEVDKKLQNQKTLHRASRDSKGMQKSLEKNQSPNRRPNIGTEESRQLSFTVPNLEFYGNSDGFTQNQGNVLSPEIIRLPVSGDYSREIVELSKTSDLNFLSSSTRVPLLCRKSPENLSKVHDIQQLEPQVSSSLTDCLTTAISSAHNTRPSQLKNLNSSPLAASSNGLMSRSKISGTDFTKHGRDKMVQPPVAIVKPSLPTIETSQTWQTVSKQPNKPMSSAYDQLFIWHTDAHVNSDPHEGEMEMDLNVLMREKCVFPAQNLYTVTVSLPGNEKPGTPTCLCRNSTELGVKQEQGSPVVRINQKELVDLSVSDAESSSEMSDDCDEVADFQTDLGNGVAMVCDSPLGVVDAALRSEPDSDYCPKTEFSVCVMPQGEMTGERCKSPSGGKDTQRTDLALNSEPDFRCCEVLDLSLPHRTTSTANFLLSKPGAVEQLEPRRFLFESATLHETDMPSNNYFSSKEHHKVSKVSSTLGNVVNTNKANDTFSNQKHKAAKVKLELPVSSSFTVNPDDVTPDSSQPFTPIPPENSPTLLAPSEKLQSISSTSKLLPSAWNPPLSEHGAARHILASLADWTNAEVTAWLQKHQLDKICPNFSSLDGRGLQRLAVQYQHDSNFYSHVKQTLGLTIFQTMLVCKSMKTLLAADTVDDAKSRKRH